MNTSGRKATTQFLYDTLRIGKYDVGSKEHLLFARPLGQSEPDGETKTYKDTNITIGGMLGSRLAARWEWVRIAFKDWAHPEDVRDIVASGTFRLDNGFTPAARMALSAFAPFLPRGGEALIKDWIGSKAIEFWPWIESPIGPVEIDSIDPFSVVVETNIPRLRGPVTALVILGPTLYIPDGRQMRTLPKEEDEFGLLSPTPLDSLSSRILAKEADVRDEAP